MVPHEVKGKSVSYNRESDPMSRLLRTQQRWGPRTLHWVEQRKGPQRPSPQSAVARMVGCHTHPSVAACCCSGRERGRASIPRTASPQQGQPLASVLLTGRHKHSLTHSCATQFRVPFLHPLQRLRKKFQLQTMIKPLFNIILWVFRKIRLTTHAMTFSYKTQQTLKNFIPINLI